MLRGGKFLHFSQLSANFFPPGLVSHSITISNVVDTEFLSSCHYACEAIGLLSRVVIFVGKLRNYIYKNNTGFQCTYESQPLKIEACVVGSTVIVE